MFVIEKAPGEVKELDETSKVLLKAAALIETRGWCQIMYQRGDALCVLGAVKTALGLPVGHDSVLNPIAEAACERVYLAVGMRAHRWNDQPGRTAEEVVSTLRRVALGG